MNSLVLLLAMLILAFPARGEPTVTVGSKRFTESYILGEIVIQAAEGAGEAKVVYRPGLGNTGIVFAALRNGAIDLYPEYTGTIASEILKSRAPSDLAALNRQLAGLGIGAAVDFGFNNTY